MFINILYYILPLFKPNFWVNVTFKLKICKIPEICKINP